MTKEAEKAAGDAGPAPAPAAEPDESQTNASLIGEAAGRHRSALIGFLRKRLRSRDEAEEVAQEAYLRLLQRERVDGIRHLSTYLFRTALNIATDRLRAERARHGSDHCSIEEVELIDQQPSVERELAARQDLARLYEAIAQLPPKCREVFVLSRVRHMTYAEIAAHCGISVKMVEKHISHALAVCLKKVGGGPSGPSNPV